MYQPEKDEMHLMKSRMLDDIVGLLGGRVAEQIIFNDISTGASNDIQRASDLARSMVTEYGMSDKLGPISFGGNDEVFIGKNYNHVRNYSETIAAAIDEEVEKIISNAYNRAETILREHIDKLHLVAETLVKLEKINEEQFNSLMVTGELPAEEKDVFVPEISNDANREPASESADSAKEDNE